MLQQFDLAQVTVQSGRGGDGKVVPLPASLQGLDRDDVGQPVPPFGGGRGGDVVLFVDVTVQTLLNLTAALEGRKVLKANDGGHSEGLVNYRKQRRWAEEQSVLQGIPESQLNPHDAPPLRVGVPPGTVVKTQAGRLLADLVSPGDEVVVAEGGAGGLFLFRDPKDRSETALSPEDEEEIARGRRGERVRLELILRSVADVGFIGFPNAGKSTLLSRLTRAKPTVGAYPFTTLIPNLGRAQAPPAGSAPHGPDGEEGPSRPVLIDLPGLITDAHRGKGLGRVFLRHARRCRALLYVLDVSSDDMCPADQFRALHRELELYNPQYVLRPSVVAINKLDLPLKMGGKEAALRAKEEAVAGVQRVIDELVAKDPKRRAPVAVVSISAQEAKGIRQLQEAVDQALELATGQDDPSL